MGIVSDFVPGPYLGVSQAAPSVRLRGSCSAMEDCIAVLPGGAQKRPPYEWLGLLEGVGGTANAYVTLIPRGTPAEDLILLINNPGSKTTTARLFKLADLTSVSLTVTPNATAYLNNTSSLVDPVPSRDIRAQTIEDTTFICNRNVKVVLGLDTEPVRPFEAIIWIKTSGYARTTAVTVSPDGGSSVTALYSTSTGGNAPDASGVGTDRIAKGLYNGTNPGGSVTIGGTPLNNLTAQGFTVTQTGSLIIISHPTVDFTITVSDDQGGEAVKAIKKAVSRFSDLPALATDGFTVEIAQEAAGGNSNYFVRFEASSATSQGVWREVVEPGSNLGVNGAALPIGIFQDPDTLLWHCDVLDWSKRTTGNVTLSPDPSFVGDYITDVKWWKERLVLVSLGSPASLSATDSPFKYYTTTLATSLASDPVGFLNPAPRKAFFQEALTYDTRLIVLGVSDPAGVVAAVSASGDTLERELLAYTPYSGQVPAQATPNAIFYGAARTNSMAIMKLSPDRVSGLSIPAEATVAVPKYLPSTIDRATSYDTDYLSFYGSSGSQQVYVNVYRYDKSEQVQNGWWRWNLPKDFSMAGMFMASGTLYSLMKRGGELHLFRQDLDPDETDPSSPIRTHLDLRLAEFACTVTFDGVDTTIEVPSILGTYDNPVIAVRANFGDYFVGQEIACTRLVSGEILVTGQDLTDVPFYVGYEYNSYFTPNTWYVEGGDGQPLREGRLTIGHLKAELADVGAMTVTVTKAGRAPDVVTFEGALMNLTDLDTPPNPQSVQMRVPVGGKAEAVTVTFSCSSFRGFKLLGYEWTGDWNGRSRRVRG